MTKSYWLVKSEPEAFSIDDLARSPRRTTCWDGVRNYQARNYLRDSMKKGDEVLFYHSNATPPAIVGTATVVREGYPDTTALDPNDAHYDPKSTHQNPIWMMVDIRLQNVFDVPLSLDQLRTVPGLEKMELLRKGSRLSVQPVRPAEYAIVLRLAEEAAAAKGSAVNNSSRSAAAQAAQKKPATKATTHKKAAS